MLGDGAEFFVYFFFFFFLSVCLFVFLFFFFHIFLKKIFAILSYVV